MHRKARRQTQGNTQRALRTAWQHQQSGRLREAVKIYQQVLKAEPRNADALGLLGMIALQLGNSEIAADLLCRAVLLRPTNPVAHRYLGDAYLNLHRLADAEACYRSSLALKHDEAEVHNRLATALQVQGRLNEAERSYRRALEHGPTLAAGVHNNLGILHAVQGRPREAVDEYRQALAIDPQLAEAHCNLGGVLHHLGETVAAIEHCHAALAANPALARGHNTLGLIFLDEYRIGEAIANFRSALASEPALASARINLALALRADGQPVEAVQVLFDGLVSKPTSNPLRQGLAASLQRVPLGNANAQHRAILASMCSDDGLSMLQLSHAVASIATADGAFPALLRASRAGEDLFTCAAAEVVAWTSDPLLLSALPRMTLQSLELERVLTGLRRGILLRASAKGDFTIPEAAVGRAFLCALARNCFLTGYAFFVAVDETDRVDAVCDRLCAEMRRPTLRVRELEDLLILVALYRPLRRVPGSEHLLDIELADWSAAFQPIVREQLVNPRRETEISQRLATITDINDDVSRAVRQQYEDNPYPPWVSAASPDPEFVEDIARRLRGGEPIERFPRPVSVLVAGCGTGHHAVIAARGYRDCQILAVDLSKASLAYATRMAEHLGVGNITFAQADILELGRLERRFAIIEARGVLHHMRDPRDGWHILSRLLLPGGLMAIGLYSERARRSIAAARAYVQDAGFDATADAIRRCRRAIMELPEGNPARSATSFGDFYSLDGCRDLIMHVQEQAVTLPRIAQYLQELDLRFLGFSCDARVLAKFHAMFPGKHARTDLDRWNRFEEAHPDAFANMYEFWCCRC